jgi:endonuclease YncB( thermonuclease family)|tara:strand:+ start:782 stop:1168 length:387 start_codon:yes stop_codon:yes gene_type:complete
MSEPFTYRLDIDSISVYDGDTIKCDIDLGFSIILKKQSVRSLGINCPEIRTKDKKEKALAYEARDQLRHILEDAEVIALQSHGKGKFGRILGTLFADGKNVNDMMIDLGLARPYDGGKRSSWFSTNVL